MENNLVTTSIKETFSEKDNNVILGDWCNPYISQTVDSKFKFKKNKFHWDDEEKKVKDYDYLQKFYYKTLDSLVDSLNFYHSTKKSKRYWHIIVGSFLTRILPILWDRWENIRFVFENENINKTKIIEIDDRDLIFFDYKDLYKIGLEDRWNHYIYSQIINFLKPKNLNIINVKKVNFKKNNYSKKNNFFNILKNSADFVLGKIYNNDKFIFYKTYIEKKNFIRLSLGLKQLPRLYSSLDKSFKNIPNLKREKFKIDINPDNDFEKFFEKILIKVLPVTYLENYSQAISEAKKIKLKPKVIVTSVAHFTDDFFKIWTAEQVEKGSKFVITDHGGYIDNKRNFDAFLNFSDLYLKWNFNNDKNSKQMPPSIFFKKYNFSKKKYNKILFLSDTVPIYPFKIDTGPISGQIVKSVKSWENFYENLEGNKKSFFKFRGHPSDYWGIQKYFQNKYGQDFFSKKKNFKDDLETSGIAINTSFSSTFFETMYSGRPNILLFDGTIFSLNHETRKLVEYFKENQILFDDSSEAARHVSKILEEPYEWWNSKKILDIRNKFNYLCFLKKSDDLKYWKEIFKSLL